MTDKTVRHMAGVHEWSRAFPMGAGFLLMTLALLGIPFWILDTVLDGFELLFVACPVSSLMFLGGAELAVFRPLWRRTVVSAMDGPEFRRVAWSTYAVAAAAVGLLAGLSIMRSEWRAPGFSRGLAAPGSMGHLAVGPPMMLYGLVSEVVEVPLQPIVVSMVYYAAFLLPLPMACNRPHSKVRRCALTGALTVLVFAHTFLAQAMQVLSRMRF
jgi:hypothetical protein